jgi:predicted permease
VSGGYFRTLGIPVKVGREFDDRDVVGSPSVVIINDEFAKRYFANESPIGKQLFPWSDKPATIVGVVRSVRQSGIDQEARSELYIAAGQNPGWLSDMTFVVSTQQRADALVPQAREVVRTIAPDQPMFLVQTMDRVIADWLRGRKLILVLLGVLAGLALLLSAAGVYGVMSYGVAQRTREIGIRVALGARSVDVTSMVLLDAAKLAGLGIVIGLAGALWLTRFLKSMLYEVGARDPVTFSFVAAMIAVVALVASAVPAIRAARVDPLQAMRAE